MSAGTDLGTRVGAQADLCLSRPRDIKPFSCSTQLNMYIFLLINHKLLTTANSFLLNIAEHENFSAIIVGIFIFISRENFMLS